jgi:hypothetical protein
MVISVARGAQTSLTFMVQSVGTYNGGLEFIGGGIDSGTISLGGSKTVQFTASGSFSFTPWWPSTSVRKCYVVLVKVI